MSESKVKKCPACGATIQASTTVCPECGYTIEDHKSNQSVKEFTAGIASLLKGSDDDALENFITGFSIPNNKSDLLEFASVLKTKRNNERCGDFCDDKYKECIEKIKVLYPNDPTFARMLAAAKKEEEEEKASDKKTTKIILIFFAFCIALGPLGIIMENKGAIKEKPDACAKEVAKLIAKDKTEDAVTCLLEYAGKTYYVLEGSFVSVVSACINKNDIESAEKICNKWTTSYEAGDKFEKVAEPIYKYLIKNKMYDEAENYIPYSSYNFGMEIYEDYYKYMESCVRVMCEDGDTDTAIKFIKRKAIKFSDLSEDSKYSEQKVLSKLTRLIESYE